MSRLRDKVIRAGLEALYFSGAHHVMRPWFAGSGTIFMLHHVRPESGDTFQPNRLLEITPDFLRTVLAHVRDLGIDIVTLDEMHRRLEAQEFSRRFACFTFDDGYRDNRDHALPVMREFDAPMTVYVASDFASGTGQLWWVALERLVRKARAIDAVLDGVPTRLGCESIEAKTESFNRLNAWCRGMDSIHDVHRAVGMLCAAHDVDAAGIATELCLSWPELDSFAADPLVTIGAHTLTHCNVAKADAETAAHEMAQSRADIEARLGRPALHFAYPYGDRTAAASRDFALARAAGFKTAVTTRPGMIFPENADHMLALPRLSLNGNYQDARFLKVLTSGAATAMWNGFRRVNAA